MLFIGIAVLIFAVIGAVVTYNYLGWVTDIQRKDMAIVAGTRDGTTIYVYTDTIRGNGQGLVEATTVTKIGRETEDYYRKRLEAIQHGKDPHKVWGIERDIQLDPEKKGYRVMAERIIDWYRVPLVTYTQQDQYWVETVTELTPFKSVIDGIMRWHKPLR